MDHLYYFCLFLLCFRVCLFIDALSSPAEKGLTSWPSFVMSNCEVVTFPGIGILGQVCCLIVSIPDLCPLSYFVISISTVSVSGFQINVQFKLIFLNHTVWILKRTVSLSWAFAQCKTYF